MNTPAVLIEEPIPNDMFEQYLYKIARRWHTRNIGTIHRLCERVGATREQRHNAINAYLLEKSRHE